MDTKNTITKQVAYLYIIASLFLVTPFAYSQKINYQSSITWTQTAVGGDFIFSEGGDGQDIFYTSDGSVYSKDKTATFISLPIKTAGNIKAVTFNYLAKGKVYLEVSIDDGKTYQPIVNGVPYSKESAVGNILRWKARLEPLSQLDKVTLDYTDSLGAICGFGSPELSGFNYRKSLNIKNENGKDLFNFPVLISIAYNKNSDADIELDQNINKDFSDLRFTAADSKAILPYYIETIDKAKNTAYVWVKIPQIPKEGVSVYVYCGNLKATTLSNAQDVFLFYDNFKDLSQWKINSAKVQSSAIDGLTLEEGEIVSLASINLNESIIEYTAKAVLAQEMRFSLRSQANPQNLPEITFYSSTYKDAEHCIAVNDVVKVNKAAAIASDTNYDFKIIIDPELAFLRYLTAEGQVSAQISYELAEKVNNANIVLKSPATGEVNFSQLIIRPYANVQPEVDKTQISKIEKVQLPDFLQTTINSKGQIILEDKTNQGVYKAYPSIPLEGIKIIVPNFTGQISKNQKFSYDISLNGGDSFIKGVTSDKFYYLAKKDFIVGDNLVISASLANSEDEKTVLAIEQLGIDLSKGIITVISPNGGEALVFGNQTAVKWSANDYEADYPINLAYSLDVGKTYKTMAEINNQGQYSWTVPSNVSSSALIKVSDANAPKLSFDVSDNVFSLNSGLKSENEATENSQVQDDTVLENESIADEPQITQDEMEAVENNLASYEQKIKFPGEEVYDVVVKINDPETIDPKGVHDGDVVLIRLHGTLWSVTEREKFLIIKVYLKPEEVSEYLKSITQDLADGMQKIISERSYRINPKTIGLAVDKFYKLSSSHKKYFDTAINDKVYSKKILENKNH